MQQKSIEESIDRQKSTWRLAHHLRGDGSRTASIGWTFHINHVLVHSLVSLTTSSVRYQNNIGPKLTQLPTIYTPVSRSARDGRRKGLVRFGEPDSRFIIHNTQDAILVHFADKWTTFDKFELRWRREGWECRDSRKIEGTMLPCCVHNSFPSPKQNDVMYQADTSWTNVSKS